MVFAVAAGVLIALVAWHYFGQMAKLIVIALAFGLLYLAVHPGAKGPVMQWCGTWLSARSCSGVQAAMGWAGHTFDAILHWMASIHG